MSDRRARRGWDVAAVARRRDKLIEVLTHAGGASAPSGLLVDALVRVLPAADRSAVFLSTQWLAAAGDIRLSDFAWALAGNVDRLKAGAAVRPDQWDAAAPEVPATVTAADWFSGFNDTPEARVVVRVDAGPGCPGAAVARWSAKTFRYYTSHPKAGFGFDPKLGRRAVHPRQLFGLRLTVRVQAGAVAAVRSTPNQQAYNAKLIDRRRRVGFDCPRGYPAAVLCHACPAAAAECQAATHATPWAAGDCPKCHARTWVDPGRPEACVGCRLTSLPQVTP